MRIDDTPAYKALRGLCRQLRQPSSVSHSLVAFLRVKLHAERSTTIGTLFASMSPSPAVDALWHELLLNTEDHRLVADQLLGGAVVQHSTRAAATRHDNEKIRGMALALTAMRAYNGGAAPTGRSRATRCAASKCCTPPPPPSAMQLLLQVQRLLTPSGAAL